MKKIYSTLLSMALLFSLAACSGGESAAGENGASEAPSSSSEEPSGSEADGALIAYFSRSGNTD